MKQVKRKERRKVIVVASLRLFIAGQPTQKAKGGRFGLPT
jgi:hypothetical protein